MDAFESLVSTLLRREGYWTETGVKVGLTKAEKRRIGRATTPRWEIDVIAYKGKGNRLLAIECKSFLDSVGVRYQDVSGENELGARRYKLFGSRALRTVIFRRLAREVVLSGRCPKEPKITLCLAVGKVASPGDRIKLKRLFKEKGWGLLDDEWIKERLEHLSKSGYEDNIAMVAAKILTRSKRAYDREAAS
jgi:hypothetical protein